MFAGQNCEVCGLFSRLVSGKWPFQVGKITEMKPANGVKVFARIRPTASFAHEHIKLHDDEKSMTVHCRKDERRGYVNNQVLEWKFTFDGVLHNASQETTFKKCASELVTKALDGYNGTLFAYGETGAGKTFTMTGKNDFKQRGIIPRALTQMYKEIKERYDHDISIRISYMQIYRDKIYDLLESAENVCLTPEQLTVTEDDNGVTYVKGLSCHLAQTEEEALSLLFEGESNRIIRNHQLNQFSSRSHCIFSIFIESRSRTISSASYTSSKLNLVDLAGSERIGKTLAEGYAQEEAMHINKSLTFLEQAVIALADQKREHVPYRQSKLTHVLKDSIGGSCRTVMIGNIWGEYGQIEETLSTLRFGNRVMCIPNEPATINVIYDPIKVCKSLEKEINALRKELSMYDTLSNRRQITYEALSEIQVNEVKDQVRKFVDGEIQDIELINVRQVKEVFEQFKLLVKQTEDEKKALQEKQEVEAQETAETPSKGVRGKAEGGVPVQVGDVQQVGEPDGQSFGVGVAPSSAKAQIVAVPSNYSKRTKSRKGKPDSGLDLKRTPSPIDNTKQVQSNDDTQAKPSSTGHAGQQLMSPPRARTPPPKGDAFAEFRKEKGKELNNVLAENKDILKSKKMEAKATVREINKMKLELDELKERLEAKRSELGLQSESQNQDEPIVDEEEYKLLKKISDLKLRYRSSYKTLQDLRSDISYCEKMVHQCRQRLITEFDAWYADCYMPITDSAEKLDDLKSEDSKRDVKSVKILEDEQEKFDQMRMELLMEDPDSVPFYNAKLQTERRMLYSGTTKRRPGSVVTQIRNKPPTSLIIG